MRVSSVLSALKKSVPREGVKNLKAERTGVCGLNSGLSHVQRRWKWKWSDLRREGHLLYGRETPKGPSARQAEVARDYLKRAARVDELNGHPPGSDGPRT